MPVYDFTFSPKQNSDTGVRVEMDPAIQYDNLISDEKPRRDIHDYTHRRVDEDVKTILLPAFEAFDRGIKEYFSDIVVPTKDGLRSKPATVRIAGGDKTMLQWKQQLKNGRIELPVIAINRQNWEFNPEKFSPPYMPVSMVYLDKGTRVRQAYRGWPCKINYVISIWTERKFEMETILTQIQVRFTPLATYDIDNGFICGTAVLKFNNSVDNSDIEIEADKLAKVRYDVNLTAEGWIPLPHEKIVPTVLGRVATLHEMNGTFLDIALVDGPALSVDNITIASQE